MMKKKKAENKVGQKKVERKRKRKMGKETVMMLRFLLRLSSLRLSSYYSQERERLLPAS